MALPVDAYPITTKDGNQIRLDTVRIKLLDYLDFGTGTGSALASGAYEDDMVYVLYATTDCIVRFDAVATNNPIAHKAVVLLGGERATIMLPAGATGFSAIGLANSGRLYIQRLTAWAGLADSITLGNS